MSHVWAGSPVAEQGAGAFVREDRSKHGPSKEHSKTMVPGAKDRINQEPEAAQDRPLSGVYSTEEVGGAANDEQGRKTPLPGAADSERTAAREALERMEARLSRLEAQGDRIEAALAGLLSRLDREPRWAAEVRGEVREARERTEQELLQLERAVTTTLGATEATRSAVRSMKADMSGWVWRLAGGGEEA